MHTRGVTKRMEKEQETEEDRREEETEAGTDIEMEQQASNTEDTQGDQPDKEEARGGLNWEKLMELMSSMKEDNKQTCLLYTSRCV